VLAITTSLTIRLVRGLALGLAERLIGAVIGLLGPDLAVPDRKRFAFGLTMAYTQNL
jgi:hypothetical protein